MILSFVALCLLTMGTNAQQKKTCDAEQKPKKKTVTCPLKTKLKTQGIKACPPTGCGSVDPLLNEQKNIKEGDPDTATDMTFAEFAAHPKCVDGYKGIGDDREPIKQAGEGKMVRIVGWALDARPQKTTGKDKNGKPKKGETCNCGFTGVNDPENTDVHIVLVDEETLKLKAKATKAQPPSAKHPKGVKAQTAARNTLKKREALSQTAEYAPRIRVARNEDFDGAKLKKMIDPIHGGRLLVRVTGLLMYDSEHAFQNPLTRRSSWEIHPVFRLEFCPKGKDCETNSDTNWVDINK
jgi:hypothetical protein